MNQYILIKPTRSLTRSLKDEICMYRNEILEVEEHINGGSELENYNNIEEWINYLEMVESADTVPQNYVPASEYMLIDQYNSIVIGLINIRHHLNDYLRNHGGHIGYSIRPKYRKRGFGKIMLNLALTKCRDLLIDNVLIICDYDNVASAKLAISCGGIEEITDISLQNGYRRFWICVVK